MIPPFPKAKPQREPPAQTLRKWILAVLSLALFVPSAGVCAVAVLAVTSAGQQTAGFSKVFSDGKALTVSSLVESVTTTLQGEDEGRTNFLLYGLTLDGERTDTIMLASYSWKDGTLTTLNIPRDLFVSDAHYQGKLVSLYSVAKHQRPNDPSYPPQYVSNFISREYGIPVQYWAVVNMNAFRDLIDSFGGITVDVAHAFVDYKYPTDNYSGYVRPAPRFSTGSQVMDGTRALIFARSRHSTDPQEGTDLARGRRQEQVIQAILVALKDKGVIENVESLGNYADLFQKNVYTNLSPAEFVRLAEVAGGFDAKTHYQGENWDYQSGFLCDSTDPQAGSILLYGVPGDCQTPAGGLTTSFYRKAAQKMVQGVISGTASAVTAPTKTPAKPTAPSKGHATATGSKAPATRSRT